jgi:hypothetical protein
MRSGQTTEELLAALGEVRRFLQRYVEGARGFTTQDVEAAVLRLKVLAHALGQCSVPNIRVATAVTRAVQEAELCVERARNRLAGTPSG